MTTLPQNPKAIWIQGLLMFAIGFVAALWVLNRFNPRNDNEPPAPMIGAQSAPIPTANPGKSRGEATLRIPPGYQAAETPGIAGRTRFVKQLDDSSPVSLDLRNQNQAATGFDAFSSELKSQFSEITGEPQLESWELGNQRIQLIYLEGLSSQNLPMAIYGAYSDATDIILIGTPASLKNERVAFLGLLHEVL